MKRVIAAIVAVTLLIAFLAAILKGQEKEDQIVTQFLNRDDAPLHEYRATRTMMAHTKRFNLTAEIKVELEAKNSIFNYTVVEESGSSLIKSRLFEILESEQELAAKP